MPVRKPSKKEIKARGVRSAKEITDEINRLRTIKAGIADDDEQYIDKQYIDEQIDILLNGLSDLDTEDPEEQEAVDAALNWLRHRNRPKPSKWWSDDTRDDGEGGQPRPAGTEPNDKGRFLQRLRAAIVLAGEEEIPYSRLQNMRLSEILPMCFINGIKLEVSLVGKNEIIYEED